MMDLKGRSWVGGIYQKFEAMRAEVEEAMCEDTFKYVENQVRTVGETVKKFYSDVIQDMHSPPSLDSVKADDLLLNVVHEGDVKKCMSQKVDDENKSVDAASEKVVNDFDGAATCDDSINYGSCCSATCNVINQCGPTSNNCAGEKCTKVNSKSHETESALSYQSSSVTKDLNCIKDSQNKYLSNFASIKATFTNNSDEQVTFIAPRNETDEPSSAPRDAISKEAYEVSVNEDGVGISQEMTKGCGGSDVVKEKKTILLSDGILSTDLEMKDDVSTTITSNVENSLEVDEELSRGYIEPSIPLVVCEFERCDGDKQEVIVGEQINKVRLGESCVLVEKYDDSSKSALEHAQKSYKKKIQDVFSPRRWSKSKRDQEQVAARYDQQIEKNLFPTMILTKIQKPQVYESLESDWELL